jgi:hypothetical protein
MAVTTEIKISGFIRGMPSGSRKFNFTFENATSVYETTQKQLASGDNTFTKPANAIGFIYVPDPDSGVTKTLKGNTGDTGIRLSNNPCVIAMGTQSTIIITASALDSGKYTSLVWF